MNIKINVCDKVHRDRIKIPNTFYSKLKISIINSKPFNLIPIIENATLLWII